MGHKLLHPEAQKSNTQTHETPRDPRVEIRALLDHVLKPQLQGNTHYPTLHTSSPLRETTAGRIHSPTFHRKSPETESHRASLQHQITFPRRASIDQSRSHPENTNTPTTLLLTDLRPSESFKSTWEKQSH
ncbi:hypothetical protein F2Q70_00004728 [Brassica cretica]|uniref:Uncharacterized protein n=1 Tax=Brassica cretica TaxID=69181 RepID=A0A8S9FVZ2_BRACR|nr:hypothetical protein F2Q68_00021558 [Brassica cretica]KAF2572234.1 hypothetical protein F2Q70_00004728 [Brassica cretica]